MSNCNQPQMHERNPEENIDWDSTINDAERQYYNDLLSQNLDTDTLVDKIAKEYTRCEPRGFQAEHDQEEDFVNEGTYPVFIWNIEDEEELDNILSFFDEEE